MHICHWKTQKHTLGKQAMHTNKRERERSHVHALRPVIQKLSWTAETNHHPPASSIHQSKGPPLLLPPPPQTPSFSWRFWLTLSRLYGEVCQQSQYMPTAQTPSPPCSISSHVIREGTHTEGIITVQVLIYMYWISHHLTHSHRICCSKIQDYF